MKHEKVFTVIQSAWEHFVKSTLYWIIPIWKASAIAEDANMSRPHASAKAMLSAQSLLRLMSGCDLRLDAIGDQHTLGLLKHHPTSFKIQNAIYN